MNVGMPIECFAAAPHVTWKHIDGPLMSWAGRLHWLTFRERVALWFGRTTIEEIAHRRFGRPLPEEKGKDE